MIIGIDVGGTNIDGVLIDQGQVLETIKQAYDKTRLTQAIQSCLETLTQGIDPKEVGRINLSTTVSTNAIVQGLVDPVTLITQKGPGMAHDFSDLASQTLVLSGYVDHRGIEVEPVIQEEVDHLAEQVTYPHLAVVSRFSTRNPLHEDQIGQAVLASSDFVSLGHRMSGRLNYPRRVHTAILNSQLASTNQAFLNSVASALADLGLDQAQINILKADGGTMTLEEAKDFPVESILSGPAASLMGMWALSDPKGQSVLLDIGGTTTDIFFLVDGSVVFEPLGIEIQGNKTLVRAIYSDSVALGGDSKVSQVDGKLTVGPMRMGPALIHGGSDLTLTDALAYLKGEEVDLVEPYLVQLTTSLQESPQAVAQAIVDLACQQIKDRVDQLLLQLNNRPVETIKEVLTDRQIEPESLYLIGGPVADLSPYLQVQFNLPTHLTPLYQVANAIGAAISKPTLQATLLADTDRRRLTIPEFDSYQEIDPSFSLEEGLQLITDLLTQEAKKRGLDSKSIEIIDQSRFNRVQGYRMSQIIRIQAQIKPGPAFTLDPLTDLEGGSVYER
ncbi:hydantoinase/oxoprolinase family protein [Hutsoniella sourekii]